MFEFNSIGEVIIRYTCELNIQKTTYFKTYRFIDNAIRTTLNPILESINSIISEHGMSYNTFKSMIYNPYIVILNITYEYQISIEDNIDLTPYINCLSPFLVIDSPQLNSINTIFKRVPNYNSHTEKESLILKLINEKKSVREIKHLLGKNFNLSLTESRR